MKTTLAVFAVFEIMALFCGCSGPSRRSPASIATVPPRLDSYFEDYCNNTANPGIGFDPSQTYDYRFRQRLRQTQDLELKRLYVLQHLFRDIDFQIDDFTAGRVRTGKSSAPSLTLQEWQNTRQSIQTQINDLAAYTAFTNLATRAWDPMDHLDPSLEAFWVQELRQKFLSATNAPPAANPIQKTP